MTTRYTVLLPAIGPLLVLLLHAAECRAADTGFRTQAFVFTESAPSLDAAAHRVPASGMYSKKKGYGLLTTGSAVYRPLEPDRRGEPLPAPGLMHNDAITFRVDVPAGAYVAELVMAGGSKAVWSGTVSVNGRLAADSCVSFSMETEGDKPPDTWTLMLRAESRDGALVFTIDADDQPSTMLALTIFQDEIGPIGFINGKFEKRKQCSAPNADLALRLINAGDVAEASRIVDAIPDRFRVEKAHLLCAMASLPSAQTPRALVEYARMLLADEKRVTRNFPYDLTLHLAGLFVQGDQLRKAAGWNWSSEINKTGIFVNTQRAGSAFEEIAAVTDHPLWALGARSAGITAYWVWIEQRFPLQLVKADRYLNRLAQLLPDDPLLKTYLGAFPSSVDRDTVPQDVPAWAFYQHKLTSRLVDVIHYWTDVRQAGNGEFGGKLDDDCEMLRWWPFARVGIDDPVALKGMKRLVDGMWTSNYIDQGFSKRVRDVEHSSEPVADTQPMMIGFDYGNPVYVERCMQSVKLMRDLWTGITPMGHRHFRSSWYSSTALDTTAPKSCDVSMNTRTVKAVRWVAWYNHHPEALTLLREWSDAWLEDCLRTDKGKPKGIVPAGIRFQDDALGGFSDTWHHPGMFWDYYDFDGEADMLTQLLSARILFSDRKYLAPMAYALDLVKSHADAGQAGAPEGSDAWTAHILRSSGNFWETAELWRGITQDPAYDSLLMTSGSAYLRFRLTGSTAAMLEELKNTVRTLENNYPLITSEGYFTDRIEVRDLREGKDQGSALLESMYLGSPFFDTFYPFPPVSWRGFGPDFSAFVTHTDSAAMKIRTYNHSRMPMRGTLTVSQLTPGRYVVRQGTDTNGDGRLDDAGRKTDTVMIDRRSGAIALVLEPRTEQLLELSLESAASPSVFSAPQCDLAVGATEVHTTAVGADSVEVTCVVHNIGIAAARQITVALERADGAAPSQAQRARIERLDAPLDLLPKTELVRFVIARVSGAYRIHVSTDSGESEITQSNNTIDFTL